MHEQARTGRPPHHSIRSGQSQQRRRGLRAIKKRICTDQPHGLRQAGAVHAIAHPGSDCRDCSMYIVPWEAFRSQAEDLFLQAPTRVRRAAPWPECKVPITARLPALRCPRADTMGHEVQPKAPEAGAQSYR